MEYRGLTLDRFQAEAITHLDEGRSVLVCAPTGTGKTLVADFVVDKALSTGRKVVYTAPIKALSNQKFRDYTRLYGEDRVGLVTGDLVIRRDAPCRVMTTEILRNMLLGTEDLSDLYAVVVDEIHFLDDPERGTVWEEVLIYLPPHVLVVGLSATLSNQDRFAAWLREVRQGPVEVVVETHRAVPLAFHLANRETGLLSREDYEKRWRKHRAQADRDEGGGRRGRGRRGGHRGRGRDRRKDRHRRGRGTRRTRHSDIVRTMIDRDLLPMLYFAFSRRNIESNARWLGRNLRADLLTPAEAARLDQRLAMAREELGRTLTPELLDMYGRGIAFHHAGLHVSLKALVEELYEDRLIKVLYCTSTFALGLNMPARGVAFDGLKKFDGRGVNPLTVRGFMQKAGRAGRRGLDEVGHVVLRIDFDEYDEVRSLLDGYFRARPEPVRSSFSLSWNSVVSLLARNDREQVREIVEKSFLAWHLDRTAERQRQEAEALEARADDLDDRHSARKTRKEARRLRKRADKADSRCWNAFVEKEQFLIRHGYVAEDGAFQAGARVLRHLQIAEIFVTELFLEGAFEGLDDPTLFGLLCALVSDFPRKAGRNYGLSREVRDLARRVDAIRQNPVVTDAEHIAQQEVTWSPQWIPVGRAWAMGEPLDQVLDMIDTETDIAGDVVGTFRRAKDLCKQIADVYGEMPARADALRALARRISRDEVEVVD
jgi:ATP-dependent RNA helicase HelY